MINIKKFCFNPFSENTFIISDANKECIIIDPGCYTKAEQEALDNYIIDNGLKPVKIINTHCHIDHILGLEYVAEKWSLKVYIHNNELSLYRSAGITAMNYGIPFRQPEIKPEFISERDMVRFGDSKLEIVFTPGHSPGSISLIHHESKSIFSGDLIFRQSIGRVDLPGANPSDMKDSLFNKILTLDDDYKIYSGHGEDTSVGYERMHNPFLRQPELIG